MLRKLTRDVWYGDWQSPFECLGEVGTIINVAHALRRRGADAYFSRMKEIPWGVVYIRMALRDSDNVSIAYARNFEEIVSIVPLPILVHCQMGGHRGPTAAVAAAYFLSPDRREHTIDSLLQVVADFKGVEKWVRYGNYHKSFVEILRERAKTFQSYLTKEKQ